MISFAPFRELIKKRKISTYFLRNKCGEYNLDNKTIDRLMNDDSVTTYTVNALCNILDCELSDIMVFLPDKDNTDRDNRDKNKNHKTRANRRTKKADSN